jgi:hypothetical protein
MNPWVMHPEQMCRVKRRRDAARKALTDAGVIITPAVIIAADAEIDLWIVPHGDHADVVLTSLGLEKIARHLGLLKD